VKRSSWTISRFWIKPWFDKRVTFEFAVAMTITPESVQTLLASADLGDRLRGVNQLRDLDPAVAFGMVELPIADRNTRVRYAAVSLMDTIGNVDLVRSLEILRGCLQDPEYDVQAAAADAIGGLQLKEALPELVEMYHSTGEWLLQLSIVAALGGMADRRALPLFQAALASETELIRMTAAQAVGELGDTDGVALLKPLIQEPDQQIRFRVAEALGKIGGKESQALLATMAKDADELVASQARAFLSTSAQ
jgi:HEAT repeat protein